MAMTCVSRQRIERTIRAGAKTREAVVRAIDAPVINTREALRKALDRGWLREVNGLLSIPSFEPALADGPSEDQAGASTPVADDGMTAEDEALDEGLMEILHQPEPSGGEAEATPEQTTGAVLRGEDGHEVAYGQFEPEKEGGAVTVGVEIAVGTDQILAMLRARGFDVPRDAAITTTADGLRLTWEAAI